MANESQFSLFGMPSPSEIRARIGKARDDRDFAISGGDLTNYTARQAGRNLGEGIGALFGGKDREVEAALEKGEILKSVLQQAQSVSGGDTGAFLEEASRGLLSAGMYEEALTAYSQLQQFRQGEAVIGKTLAETEDIADRPADRFLGRQIEAAKNAEQARANAVNEGLRGAELEARHRAIDIDQAYKLSRIELDRANVFVTNLDRHQKNRDRLYQAFEAAESPEARQKIMDQIQEINRQIEYDATRVGRSEWDRALSAGQVDELQAEYDTILNAVSDVSEMIAAIQGDPSTAGFIGWARKAGQTVAGGLLDIGAFLGSDGGAVGRQIMSLAQMTAANDLKNGLVDKKVVDTFFDPRLSQVNNFENSLSYMLARARRGPGKLNVEDVQRAHKNVRVHGWASSQDVVANLEYVLRELERSAGQLRDRMGMPGAEADSATVPSPAIEEVPTGGPSQRLRVDPTTGEFVEVTE